MQTRIEGGPSFSHIHVDLAPGETIVAESDAMASMSAGIDMKARLNGGLFSALAKQFLGGESLFVGEFTNQARRPERITLVQATPGEIHHVELENGTICLQPGAYICSTPGLKLGLRWAGLASFVGREGLFKLQVSGTGMLWYGAYGGLVEKQVNGEYIVDTSHLVAYEPQMKLRVQLAGGLFSSLLGGEGLVTRVQGRGSIIVQTRSITGLAGWLNPRL
jgi:uncharacterized protein (TIGR00266 family)